MTTPRDLSDLMSIWDSQVGTLPPGTWLIDKPIAVPPGQTLRGSGMADTIIKMTPWDGPVEEDPRGAVILLGEGSSIEGITVDARDACVNGVVAIRVSGVIVNSCRVLSMCAHTYAFWLEECKHLMNSHCQVDGGAPEVGASREQEGIEVLGGEDITIQNFSVINCGNAGINLFHDLKRTLKDCVVKDGVVSNCGIGLCASAGADCNVQAVFHNNFIRDSRIVDIKAQAGDGSIMDVLFEQAWGSFETFEVNTNCFTAKARLRMLP